MKCCKCEKEVDTTKHVIPAEWYGLYRNSNLKEVICSECLLKPGGREWWSNRK